MPETVSQKYCPKCKEVKSLTEFRTRSGKRKGKPHSECRECSKALYRKWRNSQRGREYMSKYQKENPKTFREGHRRYCERNKDKMKTRIAFKSACKKGLIVRPTICPKCNQEKRVEGHHYLGYAWENRFDVQWMCRSCHGNK